MTLYVPLKLKDSANLQEFETTSAIANQDELYLAYQVGKYLISGDSSDIGSLTMDSSAGTQTISGTFTDTVYDSAVGTGGDGSFLTFSTTTTTLRTNLGTITPVDSDYRIPVYKTNNSTSFGHQGADSDKLDDITANLSQVNLLRNRVKTDYAEILNVSGNALRIKIPSERNAIFDRFIGNSINQHDSDVDGYATHDGTVEFGNALFEPPKMTGEVTASVSTGRYEDSDKAYVINFRNVNFGGTNYGSHGAETEYEVGNNGIYVNALTQENFQTKIKEMDSTALNSLVDRLNRRIVTSDYLGSYRLGSSAPSGDYSVNLASVMTDTRTDGASTVYNIYQRTTQSAPTQVLPFAIKRSNGDSGDYQGLQLMTDRQIQQSLGLKARNRLGTTGGDAGTFIGNYKLLSSASGTPTNLGFSGTWAARGTATDTRQDIVDANYSRNRVSTYSRLRDSTFSGNYTRTRSSNYSNDYSRSFSRQYTDTYTVNRESNYSVGFVGDYSRNFTRTRSSSYTRTRQSTFNYTIARASTFTGNYSRLVTYEGNFLGDYSRTVTETTSVSGSLSTSGLGLKNITVSGTGVSDFTVTFNVSSTQGGGGLISWVGPSGSAYDEDYGVYGISNPPQTLLTNSGGVGLSSSQVTNGYTIYVNITEVPYESSSYVGNYVSSWTAGDNTPPTGAYGNWVVYGPPSYGYEIRVNWTDNGSSNLKQVYKRTFATQAERDAFTTSILGYDGVEYRRGSLTSSPATGVSVYKTEKATASYTRNSLANYTRTSTRNSTNTLSYSRNRASTFTGNYSRIVDYLGNYSRDFLGNYSRDFTRTTPDDFTRVFTGNYSRDFSRTRQSSYTRTRGSTYTGNYIGNYQGDFIGNYTRTSTTSDENPQGDAPSQGSVQEATPNIWTYKDEAKSSIAQVIYNPGQGAGAQASYSLQVYNDGVSILNTGGPFANPTSGFGFTTTTSGTFYWQDGDKSAAFSGTTSWRLGDSLGSYSPVGDNKTYKYFKIRLIGTFSNDFVGDYLRTSLRNSNVDFTRQGSDSYVGEYVGNYATNFTRTSTESRSATYNTTSGSETYWQERYIGNSTNINDFYDQTVYWGGTYVTNNGARTSSMTGNAVPSFVSTTYYRETLVTSTFDGAFTYVNYQVSRGPVSYTGNYAGTNYTRTSTRTVTNFEGNYSRNFIGNYTGEFTRARASTYLGSDTFSRTFAGNYVGNYSRNFARTFTGNYSRNFTGNYTGNYSSEYLGNYGRTFVGNYAGNSIGSGSTNIETYTLYVRTA